MVNGSRKAAKNFNNNSMNFGLLVAAREHKSQEPRTSAVSGPHYLRISGGGHLPLNRFGLARKAASKVFVRARYTAPA